MKLFLAVLGLLVTVGLAYYSSDVMKSRERDYYYYVNNMRLERNELADTIQKVNQAKSVEELDHIHTQSKEVKAQINYVKSRLYFEQGEDYLLKAINIHKMMHEVKEGDDIHPFAQSMLDKAKTYYELARQEVDKLEDSTDPQFNFNLNYMKGEIYHRYLFFLATQANMSEIFKTTLDSYKKALRSKPDDANTVINIELLIKDAAGAANGNGPQPARQKMLNLRKFGLNNKTGN